MQSTFEGMKSGGQSGCRRFTSLRTLGAVLLLLFLINEVNVRFSPADTVSVAPVFLWTSAMPAAAVQDSYAAFRGTFELDRNSEVEFRLLGASWFAAWLDGKYFAEGPARFPVAFPQYQTYHVKLKAGQHVLAVQVHHHGVPTRMLENQPPFLYAGAQISGQELPLHWKCSHISGYKPQTHRINPQLGWIEWCDTRLVPDWQAPAFDDAPWASPVKVIRRLGPLTPLSSANVR